MNIVSFDVEEWALAKLGGYDSKQLLAEYDYYLNYVLDLLQNCGINATFFCTGSMAVYFPEIIRLIASKGHEIGCHSFSHSWLNCMSYEEVRKDTFKAIDSLEQCVGKKILSYRAPAFTIGVKNKWVFEVLHEYGIMRDASIFPANRDYGGYPEFGSKKICIIKINDTVINEYPISTIKLLGKDVAYSGGGYFRFFPFNFIKNKIIASDYTMLYFHINDLVPEIGGVPSREQYEKYYKQPGTFKNRYVRYLKTNLGKKHAIKKLSSLLISKTMNFINLEEADMLIDWEKIPIVEL